jgi:hypothetical protein
MAACSWHLPDVVSTYAYVLINREHVLAAPLPIGVLNWLLKRAWTKLDNRILKALARQKLGLYLKEAGANYRRYGCAGIR